MKSSPGFLSELCQQLENLGLESLERINREGGLEVSSLLEIITSPRDYTVFVSDEVDNSSVVRFEELGSREFWHGKDLLTSGVAAHCIICDENSLKPYRDMAISRLELQLMRLSWVREVWILSDPKSEIDVKKICDSVGSNAVVFSNFESFQLRPDNLIVLENDKPVFSICGSGDLINSLKNSSVYDKFVKNGGKYIFVNYGEFFLGARPSVVGAHALSGKPVTSEVTLALPDECCPVLCEHAGFNQLVEKHRFPSKDCYENLLYSSIGSMTFDATLDFTSLTWKWHRRKIIDNKKIVVRFERTLCDLTANFQTQFIYTPRKYFER
jgi:hypothetical protein